MTLTPEQLALRRTGITATDMAAILGVHPYRSAIDVWAEKRGEAPPFEGNARTKWGSLLEPVIRSDYAERHGVHVQDSTTLVHPRHPWQMATPDGLVFEGGATAPSRGLEIKCHTIHLAHAYGAPGSDEVPHHELVQCAWGMAVTGLQRWDLVAFIDGQVTDYVLARDEDLVAMMVEAAERFRRDCLDGGAMPDPDGSEAYSDHLLRRWPTNGDEIVAADPALLAEVETLRVARADVRNAEARVERASQAIKAAIGDRAGLAWDGGKITWRRSKATRSTDWRGIAEHLLGGLAQGATADRARAVLASMGPDFWLEHGGHAVTAGELAALLAVPDRAEILEDFTTEKPGNRPFVVPRSWSTDTNTTGEI